MHSVLIDYDANDPTCTRAPRYRLRIPMRYRRSGDREWRDGRTENISRSGVLFRADDVMAPHTPIEMLLALPAEVGGGDEAATVICRGRIVRAEPRGGDPGDDEGPSLAATIAGYRIAHAQGDDPQRI